ncbi:hypothetical protein C8Q76DRAFT_384808 [Earliella scabrosa]|nr:hypothetical protein C8Q76DRAFT_384808 [Earliella scabrosa]
MFNTRRPDAGHWHGWDPSPVWHQRSTLVTGPAVIRHRLLSPRPAQLDRVPARSRVEGRMTGQRRRRARTRPGRFEALDQGPRIKVMVRGTRRAGSWARAVSRSEMPPSLPLVDAPDALRSGGRVSSSCVRMAHGYVCIMAIASVRLRASTRNVHSTRALPLELRHPPFSSSLASFSLPGRITRARLILTVLLVEVRDASGRGAGRAGRFSRKKAQLHFLLEHGGHTVCCCKFLNRGLQAVPVLPVQARMRAVRWMSAALLTHKCQVCRARGSNVHAHPSCVPKRQSLSGLDFLESEEPSRAHVRVRTQRQRNTLAFALLR